MPLSQTQYTQIRERLCRLGNFANVQILKPIFREDINSQRVYERIEDISYLIRILEKRDCIGPEHPDKVHIIIQEVAPRDAELTRILLGQDNQVVIENRFNANRVIPPVIRDITERVHQMIKMNIGFKWKELSRGLGIAEGIIEQLESRHRFDMSEAIHEVLRDHKEKCGSNEERWRVDLQRALDRAHRRDLIEEMDEILRFAAVR